MYSDKLKDHFLNPRNVLEEDEDSYEADGVGSHGSLVCGDMMKIWIQVDDNEVIHDIKWKTYGCAAAIGTTSLLSEMVKGKTIEEARKIAAEDVIEAAGGLPDQKVHCSLLGDRALRNAINDYFRRKDLTDRIVVPGVMVCECKQVTEEDIEHTVAHGVTEYEALSKETGAGTGCGKCREKVEALLEKYRFRYFGKAGAPTRA